MENKDRFDISIITPTLDAGRYINKCIASVAAQKGVRVQHIIVDGGSADDTIDLVRQNGLDLITLPGSSIYEALNRGIQNANAPLLGFINADDIFASGHVLQKVVETFHAVGGTGIVYGNCIFVDSSGREIYKLISPNRLIASICALRIFNISHPSWFIEAECIKDLGCYDTSLRYVADCDFIIRAVKNGVMFNKVEMDFAKFTLHTDNASLSNAARTEQRKYFKRLNGGSVLKRIIHFILLIHLYLRDPRYFIYRLCRLAKKIHKN